MSVVSELQTITKVEVREGESIEDFAKRLARKTNDLTDDKWETLGEASQEWANDAIEALSKKRPVPLPEGLKDLFAKPGSEESGDPTDDEEHDPETGELPPPAKKAAPPKKKAAAKTPPAKKVAAKKTAKAAAGRRGNFTTEAGIKILVDNPFREGSKGKEWFEKYKDGMTVSEALEAGVPRSQIRWDVRHEHIRVK